MKLRGLSLIIMLFVVVTAIGSAPAASAVPPDSRFRTGQLPNGLTYYIYINELPKGQMHFAIVQKPDRTPFFRRVLTSPSGAGDGVALLVRALREQHVTSPGKYRPHLQGVILVGPFQADSVELLVRRELSALPASVDIMQAQEVPQGLDSALAARAFTAKPMPLVLQDGYPRIEISFPLPVLPREMRDGSEYYVMDFMRHVMEYAADLDLEYPSCAYTDNNMVWASRGHPDSLTASFCNLAGQCASLARNGVSQETYQLARRDYLLRERWRYESRNVQTNDHYLQECIRHFFDGIPVPSATWRYRFVNEMVNYVTTDHVNRYVRGVLLSSPPGFTLYRAVSAADSLIEPVRFIPEELLEERARLARELSGLLFPFEDTRLLELAARILDIDLRLQLDSLERTQVIPEVNIDSLGRLFRQVWVEPIPGTENKRDTFPADTSTRGRVVRQMNTAHDGVSVWQLSGGSLLYIRPDTLSRGKIHFAAVEREPRVFMPFVPQEEFRKGRGPLLWKQTTQGLLLKHATTPDSLRTFLREASSQINRLLLYPAQMQDMWKEREKNIQSSRDLSRTILLDTLRTMLFERRSPGKPSTPRGFDFVCTGDICPDTLVILAEEFLAGINNRKLRTAEPVPPREGIRKGLHEHTIAFPNPAMESKAARVYSGPCPYTLEQYVLLRMLERLIFQAADRSVYVQSSLEYYPRGHYFLYIGFSSPATDMAYNEHRLEQVLADLAAYGPAVDQLEQCRHSLLVEHQTSLSDPEYHCRMLILYSRSGRDFVTGFDNMLKQTDTAMIRDFVRQIMEYGNASRVVLSGATNNPEDTSYSKNP